MKTKRKKFIDLLDKLWAETIKKRDKFKCQKCGSTTRLQSCHFHSRSRLTTRWDLLNGICLCSGCHIFWAHQHPIEFAEFMRQRIDEDVYQRLLIMAKSGAKVDNEYMEAKYLELKRMGSLL